MHKVYITREDSEQLGLATKCARYISMLGGTARQAQSRAAGRNRTEGHCEGGSSREANEEVLGQGRRERDEDLVSFI